MISPQDYFRSTKPRKAMGVNTLQPIGNSGQPGTAGLQPPKQPANHRGVSKVGLSSSSLYGPPTRSQQAARDYGQGQGHGGSHVPLQGSPTASAPTRRHDAQSAYGPRASIGDHRPELDRWTSMGVAPEDYYQLRDGQMSPKQWDGIKQRAVDSQLDKFYSVTPAQQAQYDAELQMDRAATAKSVNDARGNLGFSGAIRNEDYVDGLNRQSDYYADRRASADAMNEHQANGGGVQYRQSSTGFSLPEHGAQMAADFRSMAAYDQAKRDAYNTQQDAAMNNHHAARAAYRAEQELPVEQGGLGLRNSQQAGHDVNSLSGQYAAIARSGQAKGLKFVDFVQQKIDSGELDIGDDAVKVIQKSYGHEFSDMDKDRAGTYAQQWGNPLDRVRSAYDDRQDAIEQRKDEGLYRRQQQAAAMADDRARRADMLAQGMSPYAASVAVGKQNAQRDYYGQRRLANQDELVAGLQKHQLDLYQRDVADQRKYQDREAERAFDLANPKPTKQSSSAKSTTGMPSKNEPKQSSVSNRVTDSVNSLTSDKSFKKNDPGSLAQAARHFDNAGLSPEEHAQALGQLYDTDFSDAEAATGTIKNIATHAEKTAKAAGKWSDPYGTAQRRADATIMDHAPALRAIAYASGLTPEQVAELIHPDGINIGRYDPFLADRRQTLVDALSANQDAGDHDDE